MGRWPIYEVVLKPDTVVNAEVLCVIELTAGWLRRYKMPQGGGSKMTGDEIRGIDFPQEGVAG